MRVRLKGPRGTATLTLADEATIGDLIDQIREKSGVSHFDIKYGYPPKPLTLQQDQRSSLLTSLDVKLNNESLTISPKEDFAPTSPGTTPDDKQTSQSTSSTQTPQKSKDSGPSIPPVTFSGLESAKSKQRAKSIPLKKKAMTDVPELPLPEHGATMVMRVMPDDNSCLFRAFSTAVIPTDDDLGMPEIRGLIAGNIQGNPTYDQVTLEQSPDDYCRWIQTEDAWGGAIEIGILAKHFDIQVCSIDVQSLQVLRFNEEAKTMCILVYSGIHYDTICQSPSGYPHTRADNPPELDVRIWDSDNTYILGKAVELCAILKDKHYFTDTGGMAIKCEECGVIVYGEKQAASHANQFNHYDMAEIGT